MLRVYQEADYAAMSRRAAHIIAAEVHRNPACVLGLATGSTPIGTYENLVAWNKSGNLSFKRSKRSIWTSIRAFPETMTRAIAIS